MAAHAEAFPQNRQPSPAEAGAPHLVEADHRPRVYDEGVYYPDYELPVYDTYADENLVKWGKPRKQDEYGTTYMDMWQMDDDHDTKYRVMRCMAANPKTDVWIVKDTAWSTQPEGLNEDVARKLMGYGFNVLVKGAEIGSSVPLSNSAYNTHVILDALERRGDVEDHRIAVEGYSRGSMIGFGTNAYAYMFGRRVLYSNFTDPCVALPVNVYPMDKETAKKAATLPLDLGLLAFAAARGVLDLRHPKRGLHLLNTIDASPKGLQQFVRTGAPLMNGEAGMMAARTPDDMKATVAFFRHCRVNDKDVFKHILKVQDERPDVRFVEPAGGHGGGIDSRIIGNVAVRFGKLMEELVQGKDEDTINYRYVMNNLSLVS